MERETHVARLLANLEHRLAAGNSSAIPTETDQLKITGLFLIADELASLNETLKQVAANGNYICDRVKYLERILADHNSRHPRGTAGHIIYDPINPFVAL